MWTLRRDLSQYVPPTPAVTVVITGVDVPFGELVKLLFKLGLAAVPAVAALAVVWFVVFSVILSGGQR